VVAVLFSSRSNRVPVIAVCTDICLLLSSFHRGLTFKPELKGVGKSEPVAVLFSSRSNWTAIFFVFVPLCVAVLFSSRSNLEIWRKGMIYLPLLSSFHRGLTRPIQS